MELWASITITSQLELHIKRLELWLGLVERRYETVSCGTS